MRFSFKSFVTVDIHRDLFLLSASYYSYIIIVYWGRDILSLSATRKSFNVGWRTEQLVRVEGDRGAGARENRDGRGTGVRREKGGMQEF